MTNELEDKNSQPQPNLEDLKVEYQEVGENIRHWQNFRFVQFTALIAVTAGILTILFQYGDALPAIRLVLSFGGLVITGIFYVMDSRCVAYWSSFVRRAKKIEDLLKFSQYNAMPDRHDELFTSGNAVKVLFLSFAIFWFWTIYSL